MLQQKSFMIQHDNKFVCWNNVKNITLLNKNVMFLLKTVIFTTAITL